MDNTGRINYLEFLAATVPKAVLGDETRLRHAFDRLDADSSGFISKANLRELMGCDYEEANVTSMIASADIKNNGRIDFEEFLELMKEDESHSEVNPGTSLGGVIVEIDATEETPCLGQEA